MMDYEQNPRTGSEAEILKAAPARSWPICERIHDEELT